jgi:hypothetical protein
VVRRFPNRQPGEGNRAFEVRLVPSLEENVGVAGVELTPEDLREIESTVSKIPVQRDRYPEHLEQLTGR